MDATLAEALKKFEDDGFTGQLAATDDARVVCYTCHKETDPHDVVLDALIRTEGASDPDDMVAIAAVVCPHCGTKGTLVLHFGALAPVEHDEVLSALEDHRTASGIEP
jgi:hypothetical protein